MLIHGVAQYLDNLNVVDYRPNTTGGNAFLTYLPGEPDACVALYPTGGPQSEDWAGYDLPSFQCYARGDPFDPVGPHILLANIYSHLHSLTSTELPNGIWVVRMFGIQSEPVWIRMDENGRHEYSLNFESEVRNVTQHRG